MTYDSVPFRIDHFPFGVSSATVIQFEAGFSESVGNITDVFSVHLGVLCVSVVTVSS